MPTPHFMTINDILTPSFRLVRRPCCGVPLWQRRLSAESSFCRAVVGSGYLTQEQMERAVQRYRLGRSRDDGVIFWQIDQCGRIFDGKIMYYRPDCHRDHQRHPNWVSYLLKRHYGCLDLDIPTAHCLFGPAPQAPLNPPRRGTLSPPYSGRSGCRKSPYVGDLGGLGLVACVVEAEKTAVILSEWFPEYLWLASGGLFELTAVKLFPLRGWRIILFPDTDPDVKAYSLWFEVARKARRDFGLNVSVSTLLERQATAEQKRRKIDLVDFLFGAAKRGVWSR